MASPQPELQIRTIELVAEAFETFCEDLFTMFEVDAEATPDECTKQNVRQLRQLFKKLAAVYTIKAEGTLNGAFHLILSREGLFTLAGIAVMLPEQRILRECKHGVLKEAENLRDAIGEVGNLMVGSWDRVFREGLEGHSHFKQINTFIGNPWENPEELFGLKEQQESLFIPIEMTVAPYPPFLCGVIFPETLFETETTKASEQIDEPQQDNEQSSTDSPAGIGEEAHQRPEPNQPAQEPQQPQAESEHAEASAKAVGERAAENDQAGPEDGNRAKEKAVSSDTSGSEPNSQLHESAAEADHATSQQVEPAQVSADNTAEQKPISEAIKRMTNSPAILPGEGVWACLAKPAKEVMSTDLVWVQAEQTVEQALEKMHENDTGYLLVGAEGKLEGLVSKSDLLGAMSPYLRPLFSKWRRPLDDATLQIKIKWIMTRPVRTIGPQTPVAVVMDCMCRFGGRCLPVADKANQVLGLITVFDIFKALLAENTDFTCLGKPPQAPPLNRIK